MANFIDSKRISISDLYRSKVFKNSKIIVFNWDRFSSSPFTDIEDRVAISKIHDQNILEIGYILIKKDGEKKRYHYDIKITPVRSNINGFVYYFICPLSSKNIPCGKKVSVLYKPENEAYFGCRHCHKIRYSTQTYNQRSGSYTEIKRHTIEKKIDLLNQRITKKTYRDKKTRKQLRIERLIKLAKGYPSDFY